MKTSVGSSLRHLNDCGCCEGLSVQTPVKMYNRPGLEAIVYRVGIYSQFKETLLAQISGSRQPALRNFTTRDDDDFSIALLDAWACVADILTFYQERMANEAFLRTATERLSFLELARLIGHKVRHGVAASTYMAFTLEDKMGTLGQELGTNASVPSLSFPPPVTIDIGTKVQSVPGPDEQAQIFETVEKIEARAEWNAIKPRLTQAQEPSINEGFIILKNTAINLKQGDTLLIVEKSGATKPKKILNVTLNEKAKTTRLDFEIPSPSLPSLEKDSSIPEGKLSDYPDKVKLDESVIQDIASKSWKEEDLSALVKIQEWPEEELVTRIAKYTAQRNIKADTAGIFALRQRAAIFGHNAPKWDSLPTDQRFGKKIPTYNNDGTFKEYKLVKAAFETDWEDHSLEDDAEPSDNKRSIYLDNVYSDITKGNWIVLQTPSGQGLYMQVFKVTGNIETTRSDFAISAKVSRLRVEWGQPFNSSFKMRTTTVLGKSEKLSMADLPIKDLVQNDTITLDRMYLNLKAGQKVIISGERNDAKGVTASEIKVLKKVTIEKGFTVLTLNKPLTNSYVRNTVTINANIALASHGESVQEVLGSGDASQSFQKFTLKQPPLTFISASSSSGAKSTLEIRVNDLLWKEVPSFFGHGPEERIYVTQLDNKAYTTVIFGDGKTGARLPTGQENVRAKYRKGIGLSGIVKQNQITQLMTRPLGVKEASNPIASSGAADSESLTEIRRNAPLVVLTLGRIVSLQDYEDFACAFAGIDKALATWSWIGRRRGIFLTVAGSKGAIVKSDSTLYKNLLTAMRKAGDPNVPLLIESYKPCFFCMKAKIQVKSDYLPEKVLLEIKRKLRNNFSFIARDFGQFVARSEVISIIHGTSGVKSVDLDKLYRSNEDEDLKTHLEAALPIPGSDIIFPAELLTIDPRPITLEIMP